MNGTNNPRAGSLPSASSNGCRSEKLLIERKGTIRHVLLGSGKYKRRHNSDKTVPHPNHKSNTQDSIIPSFEHQNRLVKKSEPIENVETKRAQIGVSTGLKYDNTREVNVQQSSCRKGAKPLIIPTQSANLNRNLCPAPLPHNPIDNEGDNSTPLEKEVAWLLEESDVILPSLRNDDQNRALLLLLLDFAWKHGSLQLREKMWEIFPSKIDSLVKKLNGRGTVGQYCGAAGESGTQLTFIDGYDLLWSRDKSQTIHTTENFSRLRKEARNALQLGYRRSESIERELNAIQRLRWREAVEEMGKPGDDEKYGLAKPKQSRHRRKRLKNEVLLQTALGQDRYSPSGSQSGTELETIASNVPLELTTLEDEVAWLVEESLILLPDDMINNKNVSSKQIESVISAGLVTKSADIKWDYVANNGSELLKQEFKRIGGIKRRPLQRIIRYQHKEVRCAFQKRRDEIASLLLTRGYRRNQTKHSVPSPELLLQTGLNEVWAVRLMRRRQHETADNFASSKELRLACNARLGGKEYSVNNPQRPNKKSRVSHATALKKSRPSKAVVRLGVTQKAHSSILTANDSVENPQHTNTKKCVSHTAASSSKSQPLEAVIRSAVTQKLRPSILPVENSLKNQQHANEKCVSHTTASLTKLQPSEVVVRLAVTQKGQSSILTSEEEELAWLREEYESETGVKCYDWDYVEKNSSLPLLISLAEKRCAPSSFPSVAGQSRLRAMVRLNTPSVKEAFDGKRLDIRYAITQLGFRRDRSTHLPVIPSAPTSFSPPLVRKNGTSVLDVEYACFSSTAIEIICIYDDSDDEANGDQSEKIGSSCDNSDQFDSGKALGDKKENPNAPSCDTPPEGPLCDGDISVKKKDVVKGKGKTTEALPFGSYLFESANMSDGQSEEEVMDDSDDDEYEVSSDDESEDSDV